MQVDTEKEIAKNVLKRPRRETLSDDEELSKVEHLEDQITEAQIVVNGKNEIIRLPEIETVYYHSTNENNEEINAEETEKETKPGEGRRVVELAELGKRLWCGTCKEALSLSYMEKECRRGLGCLLIVRCHKCLVLNEVNTGKMHDLNTDRRCSRFDMNTDLALCAYFYFYFYYTYKIVIIIL